MILCECEDGDDPLEAIETKLVEGRLLFQIIPRESVFRQCWDGMIAAITVFSLFYTPLQVSQ